MFLFIRNVDEIDGWIEYIDDVNLKICCYLTNIILCGTLYLHIEIFTSDIQILSCCYVNMYVNKMTAP